MSKIALEGNASGTGTFTIASPNSNSNYTLTLPSSTGTVVVTGGAQTIEFAAGTAASPSITFTGDTNTGIFSPGADTIAFSEGGAEAMRIDSGGNVGIGTTSPSSFGKLAIRGGITVNAGTTSITGTGFSTSDAINSTFFINHTSGCVNLIADTALTFWGASGSGVAERMRIDSSGNVFVGGTANLDSNKLNVLGAKTISSGIPQAQLAIGDTTTLNTGTGGGVAFLAKYNANDLTTMGSIEGVRENATSGNYAGALVFKTRTNGSDNFERARITSGGDFCVNATSSALSTTFYVSGSIGAQQLYGPMFVSNENNTDNVGRSSFNFQRGGVLVGQIVTTNSTCAYNSVSDYRLKENIQPMTGALAKVAQLNPVTYTWKSNGTAGQGFIAHELQAIVPDCVSGEKDAIDAEGNPIYQGVDTSFLVATLTAAIQELKAITDAQATRIETLEAEVAALKGQ